MMRPADPVVDLDRERRVRANLAELRDLLTTDADLAERTDALLAGVLPCPDMEDSPMTDDRVSLTVRVLASYLERADAVLAKMDSLYRGPDPLGLWGSVRLSRSLVLRSALARGLEVLEREVGIAPPSTEPAAAEPDDMEPASAFVREYRKPSRRSPSITVAGRRLRRWRESNGLTQTKAAERFGKKQAQWGKYEKGTSLPRPALRAKLEDLAGIDPDDWTTPNPAAEEG